MPSVVHVSRQPESIIYNDRDIIALIPDRLRDNPNGTSIVVKAKETDTTNMYEVIAGDMPIQDERILMYSRTMSNGNMTNGLRCCIYSDPTTDKPTQAKVMREIISPRLTYDRSSNVIMLMFWTNFEEGFNETEYNEDSVYRIDENTFSLDTKVVRGVCCASGNIRKANVVGGGILDITGGSSSDDEYDLIPIFNKPKILQLLPIPDTTGGIAIVDFAGAGGGGSVEIVQATDDGANGLIKVKNIQLGINLAAHPNFAQTGDEFELSYFQL